jgi:hypothetical protein
MSALPTSTRPIRQRVDRCTFRPPLHKPTQTGQRSRWAGVALLRSLIFQEPVATDQIALSVNEILNATATRHASVHRPDAT